MTISANVNRLIAAAILTTPALTAGALAQTSEAGPPVASTAPAPAAKPGASLTVTFSNIAEPKGEILFALFDNEASFDRGGKAVRTIMLPVTGNTASIAVPDLPPGRYGIKALHDLDGDKKMTSNPYGMPIEPFAFSNNAVGNMGPAKWVDAAFDVAGNVTHSITFP
jgi:uncharacterized protein (DUF2141 family)